jgi:hypothetical protein
MPDWIPLSRARERGRGEGEQRLLENDSDYVTRWQLIKNDCWVSLRSTQPTPAMPDRIPLSQARERGRGEGEQRHTSGATPTDFRYTGQILRSLQLCQYVKPTGA